VRPDLGKVRSLIARYEARDGSGIDEAAFMDLFGCLPAPTHLILHLQAKRDGG